MCTSSYNATGNSPSSSSSSPAGSRDVAPRETGDGGQRGGVKRVCNVWGYGGRLARGHFSLESVFTASFLSSFWGFPNSSWWRCIATPVWHAYDHHPVCYRKLGFGGYQQSIRCPAARWSKIWSSFELCRFSCTWGVSKVIIVFACFVFIVFFSPRNDCRNKLGGVIGFWRFREHISISFCAGLGGIYRRLSGISVWNIINVVDNFFSSCGRSKYLDPLGLFCTAWSSSQGLNYKS